MSDYIMHSSGTWKNHKWIRREGSPGNYKYYYKNSDSDSSSSSKKYTDDPDYNPSTPYTNQYKDKNGKKHGMSTGSGTADTVRDTAYGTAGKSNYYGNQKLDSKKRARDISELKRRAKGASIRDEMVNRMIDAMSGKTVTEIVDHGNKPNYYKNRTKKVGSPNSVSDVARWSKNNLERMKNKFLAPRSKKYDTADYIYGYNYLRKGLGMSPEEKEVRDNYRRAKTSKRATKR